jgi:hypothetical protein
LNQTRIKLKSLPSSPLPSPPLKFLLSPPSPPLYQTGPNVKFLVLEIENQSISLHFMNFGRRYLLDLDLLI